MQKETDVPDDEIHYLFLPGGEISEGLHKLSAKRLPESENGLQATYSIVQFVLGEHQEIVIPLKDVRQLMHVLGRPFAGNHHSRAALRRLFAVGIAKRKHHWNGSFSAQSMNPLPQRHDVLVDKLLLVEKL